VLTSDSKRPARLADHEFATWVETPVDACSAGGHRRVVLSRISVGIIGHITGGHMKSKLITLPLLLLAWLGVMCNAVMLADDAAAVKPSIVDVRTAEEFAQNHPLVEMTINQSFPGC
jgi:hypothetical protein